MAAGGFSIVGVAKKPVASVVPNKLVSVRLRRRPPAIGRLSEPEPWPWAFQRKEGGGRDGGGVGPEREGSADDGGIAGVCTNGSGRAR